PAPAGARGKPQAKVPAPKKNARKPHVFHVFAVPDGAATWLGFGLDGKLVGQKAAASLASAPDTGTLGKVTGMDALHDGKMSSGGLLSLRGFLVFTALSHHASRSPFAALGMLPHKGTAPVIITGRAEAPSATAKGGAGTGTLHVSRAVIEDIVKLAVSSR
ncbi:MAG TPA: hypothetical protein VM580_02615, partial [Labilithrix sp.]|nr:hypothetical protein [Labilithrix sp.]